ncbi:serine protease inhibitor Kazal-type 2 [Drosophila mauritiana]|uniref:Serine protease inhibitor Kazal-type 2 n=1 Tax=Drosophila mauritiana TaxID=7226 RepID=A0A6P8LFB8_DROMA|nr:serine protease inhibitor Kazal-type 2 [Drosophila mauritiana]
MCSAPVSNQSSKWINPVTMKFLSILVALCLLLALTISPISCDDTEKVDKPFCPCPRNYEPVCGSNLVTYPNRCEFDCVRRNVERQGRSMGLLRDGTC